VARLFDDASSQFLEINSAVRTAMPMTFAGWFNTNDGSASQDIISICDSGAETNYYRLIINSSGVLSVKRNPDTGDQSIATSSANYSTNTWSHGAAVFSSATSNTVYLNGGNSATNTDNVTPTGANLNRTSIGRLGRLSATGFFSGMIAECGIWSVALTAADVASLAKGVSPLKIRPDALVAYWPIMGRTSPEMDVMGGFSLSVTGATTAEHPRIIRRRPVLWKPSYTVSATNHATEGELVGPGSTLAGTATNYTVHTTTGVLTGPGAAVDGTAANIKTHATEGDLVGPGAVVTGEASHASDDTHVTTGDLVGPGSALAGTAARTRAHATDGELVGPGAVVTGVASRVLTHETTGDLVGSGAVLRGSAQNGTFVATGAGVKKKSTEHAFCAVPTSSLGNWTRTKKLSASPLPEGSVSPCRLSRCRKQSRLSLYKPFERLPLRSSQFLMSGLPN
jgi:hypothetical protein